MPKVLILEDEENIRSFVSLNLKRAGYTPVEAERGEDAIKLASSDPDIKVALLDIMLPDMSGLEVCRQIRAMDRQMGIIMLTARSQEMDKVTGFMNGADDYVTKPFSPSELTARIDALSRRVNSTKVTRLADGEIIVDGPFRLVISEHTVERNGEILRLTQLEYLMMKLFMENPGRIISREEILHAVWGRDYYGGLKIVDVNVRRLRLKIGDDANDPQYIKTVWGQGYRWGD